MKDYCPYCSSEMTKVYHLGMCPRVKSIDYYQDGTVKTVHLKTVSEQESDQVKRYDSPR